jgi:hypothetical protein
LTYGYLFDMFVVILAVIRGNTTFNRMTLFRVKLFAILRI